MREYVSMECWMLIIIKAQERRKSRRRQWEEHMREWNEGDCGAFMEHNCGMMMMETIVVVVVGCVLNERMRKRCGCLFRTGSWISERLENICVIININKARVCFLHCDGAPFMNDGREFLLSKHLRNWLLNKWFTHKSADFPSKWSKW